MNKTTYRDNFGNPDPTSQLKPKDKDLWKQKNNKYYFLNFWKLFLPSPRRSPITTGIPFLGETTHAATYKPFKVSGAPQFETADVSYFSISFLTFSP